MVLGEPLVTERDCLLIAVHLASNIVRFQENWLRSQWSLEDIVFPEIADDAETATKRVIPKYAVEIPYLSWRLPGIGPETLTFSSMQISRTGSMTKCPILFPLGLALVELALWQPLSKVDAQDDDADANSAVGSLRKATRLLPFVADKLGRRSKDVVEECLSWPSSRARDTDLDDEDFQGAVYQDVVFPLLKELNAFDGR